MWSKDEIQALFKKLNLNQKEFAKAIGVSTKTVRRWLKGKCRPNKLASEKLNKLYNKLPIEEQAEIKTIWYYPTNDWGEFKWVKVTHRNPSGGWSRWKWYPADKVGLFHESHNHTLVFQTIGHFKFQDTESKQISNFCLEWDVGGKTEEEWKKNFLRCRRAVILTYERFYDFGVDNNAIRIFFSGGRSYHMEIAYQTLGIEPQPLLNQLMKQLALEHNEYLLDWGGYNVLLLDESLYANPKMYRTPGSRYPKGDVYPPHDTYKIELSIEEVQKIEDITELWELAKSPRPPLYSEDVFSEYKPVDYAVEWVEEQFDILKDLKKESETVPVSDSAIQDIVEEKDIESFPLCIQDLMKSGIKKKGTFNQAVLSHACFLKAAGISKKKASSLINSWAPKVSKKLTSKEKGKERSRHNRSVLRSVYSDDKYRFSCAACRAIGLKCNYQSCPLHYKMDISCREKNIVVLEEPKFEDDKNTKVVDTLDKAHQFIAEKIREAAIYQKNIMLTADPGLGKTTTTIRTLEEEGCKLVVVAPRRDLMSEITQKVSKKGREEWHKIRPRRPLSPPPRDEDSEEKWNQWRREALCPLFQKADELAKYRYQVARILCSPGSKEFINPNWCEIPKEACLWWKQFRPEDQVIMTREYAFISSVCEDLTQGYEKVDVDGEKYPDYPVFVFDEFDPSMFYEDIIISTDTISETLKREDIHIVRKLLGLVRKVIEEVILEDEEKKISGNEVMRRLAESYKEIFSLELGGLLDRLNRLEKRDKDAILIKTSAPTPRTTDKAYFVYVNGKGVFIPKEFEIHLSAEECLFSVPYDFAEEKGILPEEDKEKEEFDLFEEPVLQFVDDLIKYLTIEYERYKTGNPYNSVLTIKNTIAGPSLIIKKRREVKVPPNSPCFLLDARGSSSLASQLFGIDFEEIKVTKKMDCHIIQIVDGNYGITTLYNKETKKPKRSFYRLMEVVKNIAKLEGADNLFLCTWKKLVPFIEKMQKGGELSNKLSINHFGNIKGSNAQIEREACIILGAPCYPPDELHSIAQTAYYEQEYVTDERRLTEVPYQNYVDDEGKGRALKTYRYVDERMEKVRRYAQELGIVHAAHRIRPKLSGGKRLYLLTNLPIPELPPDELLDLNELRVQTDIDFRKFEEKLTEFYQKHGFVWESLSEEFTDATARKLRFWFRLACDRNELLNGKRVAINQSDRISVWCREDEEIPECEVIKTYKDFKIKKFMKAEDIKGLREWLGMTQEEFAKKISVSQVHVSYIEQDKRSLSSDMLENILEKLRSI